MSVTEEIKSRLDIVNFVSQYVPLKKAGRNYNAPCPFHNERTPSFIVFPETQYWKCFGACSEGGDIFSFIMKREGYDFSTALHFLADKAGVELQKRSDEQIQQDQHLDKLRGLVEEAARFFHNMLRQAPEGRIGRAYMQKRGIEQETAIAFQLGYAPDSYHSTLDHLLKIGYIEDDIVTVGLAIRNDEGRVYDRFRNRFMIPICDGLGRVIGFGARALNPDDHPKYLNSPQTPLFDKSATLFGLHIARPLIRELECAVIVEGYMDVIQAHQAKFTNVVAQMGTAMTEPQLKQLGKYAKKVILALDPDVAGMKATMRGLNVIRLTSESGELFFDPGAMMRQASKLDLEIRVLTLPEGQDPDDLIRNHPEEWKTRIESAQPVEEYVIQVGTAHLTPQSTINEREQTARDLLPILIATENDLHRQKNIQQLALTLRLKEYTLIEWAQQRTAPGKRVVVDKLKVAKGNKSLSNLSRAPEPATSGPQTPKNSETVAAFKTGQARELHLLALLLRHPDWLSGINRRLRSITNSITNGMNYPNLGALSDQDFTRSESRVIFNILVASLAQDDHDPIEYIELHVPEELRDEVLQLRVELLEASEHTLNSQRQSRVLRTDFQAVLREQEITRAVADNEQTLLHYALKLRKARLERENIELQYLQQDADPETDLEYSRRVSINKRAIMFIDGMLRG